LKVSSNKRFRDCFSHFSFAFSNLNMQRASVVSWLGMSLSLAPVFGEVSIQLQSCNSINQHHLLQIQASITSGKGYGPFHAFFVCKLLRIFGGETKLLFCNYFLKSLAICNSTKQFPVSTFSVS